MSTTNGQSHDRDREEFRRSIIEESRQGDEAYRRRVDEALKAVYGGVHRREDGSHDGSGDPALFGDVDGLRVDVDRLKKQVSALQETVAALLVMAQRHG